MDQLIGEFVKNASTIEKGVFLMIAGVVFVFVVQVVFYMVVKIWPRPKA
jgi:Na+-transporting methylmalonyl-CoA/oxaloacetate decarboxylase gamma subunit